MRNLFGRIPEEYKTKEHLNVFFTPACFKAVQDEVRKIAEQHEDKKSCSELVAEAVLTAIEGQDSIQRALAGLLWMGNMKKVLHDDIKFIMIGSYYYEQISNGPKFGTNSAFTNAFHERKFTYSSKRTEIHNKSKDHKPLAGFFPQSKKQSVYNNLIDMGLVQAVMATKREKENPYLLMGPGRYEFSVFDFLQYFDTAYIDKKKVVKLLTEDLPDCNLTSYKDTDLLPRVKMLKEEICPEGYAVLNQFMIERLTNLNFIIALHNLLQSGVNLGSGFRVGLSANYFDCWLTVPLFKTRNTVLINHMGGVKYSEELDQRIPSLLQHDLLPSIYGLYYFMMKEEGFCISKDEPFFRNIYSDPGTPPESDREYKLFYFNSDEDDKKKLCPVEKFIITDPGLLNQLLTLEVTKSKNDRLLGRINKRTHFTTNYKNLLNEYKTECNTAQQGNKVFEAQVDMCMQTYKTWEQSAIEWDKAVGNEQDEITIKNLKDCCDKNAEEYNAQAGNVRKLLSQTANDFLDISQKFGLPRIPGTEQFAKRAPHSFYYVFDLLFYDKNRDLLPEFAILADNECKSFDRLTEWQYNNEVKESRFLVSMSNYEFDRAIAKISTLKEQAVNNREIIIKLENLYKEYAGSDY